LSEKGSVRLKSGEVTVVQGLITDGEFVIDMNTIESTPHKDRLVAHLKSDDFFGVESYPIATFKLKSMAATSELGAKEGRYVIAGNLTVKGITKPISFTTTLKPDGDSLSGSASFAINRADWEVKYNSSTFFKDLGDKIIRDAVTIGLDLKAERVIQ
jgi:polyisoprenoid-binding protein YceI